MMVLDYLQNYQNLINTNLSFFYCVILLIIFSVLVMKYADRIQHKTNEHTFFKLLSKSVCKPEAAEGMYDWGGGGGFQKRDN